MRNRYGDFIGNHGRLGLCPSDKRTYASKSIAKVAAKQMTSRHRNNDGHQMGVYRCEHCHLWHLYDVTKAKIKRKERRKRNGASHHQHAVRNED